MYIIDNNKDFYDYVSHIYGTDKQIILDRRESARVTDESLLYVSTENYPKYERETFLLLEYGFVQKIFRLFNLDYIPKNLSYTYDIEHFHTYSEHVNLFGCPISISRCLIRVPWVYRWEKKKNKRIPIPSIDDLRRNTKNDGVQKTLIKYPILKDTQLTKFLDPIEVWSEIQNYISSLNNDPNVDIPMSNKERAALHGFDKYSFRHPIK